MIGKDEIASKLKEFEVHPSNVERDYVFGWLIFGIFTASNLKDTIFLISPKNGRDLCVHRAGEASVHGLCPKSDPLICLLS